MVQATILGRAYIYDDEPNDVQFWCHELEPMDLVHRGSADWTKSYFEDLSDSDLREMFELPEEGNFQVLFTGTMSGYTDYTGEWDEGFDVEKHESKAIPEEFIKGMFPEAGQG